MRLIAVFQPDNSLAQQWAYVHRPDKGGKEIHEYPSLVGVEDDGTIWLHGGWTGWTKLVDGVRQFEVPFREWKDNG
jgi:hypothetical protein